MPIACAKLPVLVPQITGGAAFPGEVTENWSSIQRDTSMTFLAAPTASPAVVPPTVVVTVDGPAITEIEKKLKI